MNKDRLLKTAKPILFNTEMVRAIQDGRKTQTRRAIKSDFMFNPDDEYKYYIRDKRMRWNDFKTETEFIKYASKYQKGDILWIREPAKVVGEIYYDTVEIQYLSDNISIDVGISRFKNEDKNISTCPKWIEHKQGIPNGCIKEMARIFLRVTDVKVERVQDIDSHNAPDGYYLEGLEPINGSTAKEVLNRVKKDFISLWNSTTKDGYKWDDNPYVFVYEFEVIK